jgi:glycosyltransferase involved in cell wall biosynthesis
MPGFEHDDAAAKTMNAQIAIVVPTFKHSSLMLEAIASVRAACLRADAHVVIIDDGCPYFQTAFSGALAVGSNIHYVRQINRGLSGARNCGIDFVLDYLPQCAAIYFLDADNKLSSFSITRFQDALARSPDIDWFYPDIVMTGIPWSGDYSGPFRCLTETLMNICEAGSLVRRRVFETGLRFDEKMRMGYEDWEFWISLMERGFAGAHLPASGFLYRKRAESMLADSGRRHEEILGYMKTKHPWMRDVKTLIALEHWEAPRFAVVCSDTSTVLLGSDPAWMKEYSIQQYESIIRLSHERPNWVSAGAIMVFSSKAVLSQLKSAGLLHSIFWRAEVELDQHNFVSICISAADDQYSTQTRAHVVTQSDLLFLKMPLMRDVLADESDGWIMQITDAPESIDCGAIDVKSPQLRTPTAALRGQQRALYEFARRMRMRGMPVLWSGRSAAKHEGTPDVTLLPARLRNMMGRGVLPCRVNKTDKAAVAMLLPIMEFGGVEKVAFRVACEFRRRGFTVDLVIYGNKRAYHYDAYSDGYDQLYVMDHVSTGYGGAVYEGTYLPNNAANDHPEIENLLLSYDVVINCHAAGALHNLANLRRAGVVTVNYIHLIEYTHRGLATGHPIIGLAFEHSIDIMACCSQQMAAQIAALGVPREKILEVPNGPGTLITQADVAAAAAHREAASTDQPLKVLYFGRLDAQKGLDHLSEIVASLKDAPDTFQVRVVGGQVIASDHETLGVNLDNEPPVYADDAIAELYQWADVIVMPSRFEGLPLTIIEAMMLGVVPIVTDVGAVAEAVRHGEDGYVVSGDHIAKQMLDLIQGLSADRETLRRLSRNASRTAASRDWTLSTMPLIDRVASLLRQRSEAKKGITDFRVLKQPWTSSL